MIVFRLTRKKYLNVLSGVGSSIAGGRFNSKGIEIIYCTDSRALAMAEVAVYLSVGAMPTDYLMSEIEIPKSVKIEKLDVKDLPISWDKYPHLKSTQKLGDRFIYSKRACVFRVPSAVVQGDFNYLINQNHPDFKKIKVVGSVNFPFDVRLVKS